MKFVFIDPRNTASVGLNHFCEQKFKRNFQNCLNVKCICVLDVKSSSHFYLWRPIFNDERYTLLNSLNKIDCKLLKLTFLYHKLCYMVTHYLIKTHSFLTGLLKIFHPLKDSIKILSRCFIIFTFFFILLAYVNVSSSINFRWFL